MGAEGFPRNIFLAEEEGFRCCYFGTHILQKFMRKGSCDDEVLEVVGTGGEEKEIVG